MVGCISGGYVVLFYLVATQLLGGWSPMDVPNVDLYATPLPLLGPLALGVVPAFSEELQVRLIGTGALLRLSRKRWLAVVVPGILWAFAHLAYVRDPIYLRGVELTGMALLYGCLLLRFDLTTTIVAHLTYNAGLGILPLLRSGHPYYVANGALVLAGLVAPALGGAVRRIRRGSRRARMQPAIRPTSRAEIPRLSQLGAVDVDWLDWLEDPSATVLGLWAGADLVGVAAGRVEGDRAGRAAILYVAPPWRRRYWGSRLAEALGSELQRQGALTLEVTVPADAWTLRRFWDTQGWEPSSTTYIRPRSPGSLGDALAAGPGSEKSTVGGDT
jgi:membrane protease YdiL (CAAX protease family)